MNSHFQGRACSVMVILVENGPGEPSSNPGLGFLHFP